MKIHFNELKLKIEAILFTAEEALDVGSIRSYLGEVSLSDVRMALRALSLDYESRAFEIYENKNKYQIKTRNEYIDVIKKQHSSRARSLSKSALETLSIIAYKQPLTKAQINAIRQHDSSSILQSLKEKELIYISGTKKDVGNPVEYRTTEKFLDVFSLESLDDLPHLRSLQLNLDEQKHAMDALTQAEV